MINGEKLLAYACEKFERQEYDQALEAFVLAYDKGYESQWILENIYNCYMSENEMEFRRTYEWQSAGQLVAYEDCILDFVPCREGVYYIFDKEERIFRGVFSIPELQNTKQDPAFEKMEFSAAALALDWDFREEMGILTAARERKIYIVCRDVGRCLSFWKIPELEKYLRNIKVFEGYKELQAYFHENTSVYLPTILHGSSEECRELERIREEEHEYRLTPQGRNTENVLLTIAIPTAHRGNLLLKRLENLLKMPYDAEIEIAVSKNCNDLYEEEYRQAGEIQDTRLRYYDHNRDLQGHQSFHYAVKMSCGKYVMLVSDEDDVIISALEHYLKLLDTNPKLSLVRARNVNYYSDISEREYGKKGLEAFNLMFLSQNYISGLIMNRKDFMEEDFPNSLRQFADNVFFQYYPHEWWCAMLCRRGDAVREPVTLINEGEPVRKEEVKSMGIELFPSYASYAARLEQVKGQVEFLLFFMKDNKKGAELGLMRVINKTCYLFEMVREMGHDVESYQDMVNQYIFICMEAIEKFDFEEESKVRLLKVLKECGIHAIAFDIKLKNKTKQKGNEKSILGV